MALKFGVSMANMFSKLCSFRYQKEPGMVINNCSLVIVLIVIVCGNRVVEAESILLPRLPVE